METRTQISVQGIVQGVGFRPFIFSLATKMALKGKVFNNATGVFIDVEGDAQKIRRFIENIKLKPPPLSRIESVELNILRTPAFYKDFRIVESETNGSKFIPISADLATCADCLREMFDPADRRFRYPFINCTNCGPRFTIIENVPYDRARTTMREFEMCAECLSEYEDPLNRRFHAEPTCCPACGPRVFLSEPSALAGGFFRSVPPAVAGGLNPRNQNAKIYPSATADGTDKIGAGGADIVNRAKQFLLDGKILAVKGIGGFHLVCDARNKEAVETLRKRKYREDKPFALMANSVEIVEKYCFVSETEKNLLLSRERPIVLLERKPDAEIAAAVAPKMNSLGFMLPYAPLHFLLLDGLENPLVMTSGNVSDEPICFDDAEAREKLNKIADHYLVHDRRIHIRTDDSVVRVIRSEPPALAGGLNSKDQNSKNYPFATANGTDRANDRRVPASPRHRVAILRRSRGYAPAPIKTSFKFEKQILACGAELKNTFCLTKDNYAFVSHHIGDLENLETLRSFTSGIEHYKRLFNLSPEIIAYDLHPEYLSTKYALDANAEKIGIQHHHAHIASCLADNGAEGEVIGVAMDGTGFGTDGKIWGGEFFVADLRVAERVAHLEYVPLAGGAKAIKEPWRMAAVYLQKTFGDEFLNLDLPFVRNLNRTEWKTLRSMIRAETNCPETSSMGRLFDAVSSLLCSRNSVNYEGQAAIELEMIADKTLQTAYEFEIENGIIKSEKVIRKATEDLLDGVSAPVVSAKFHVAVADLITKIARELRDERNLNRVALSGGVFQNMFLLERVCKMLTKAGFEILTHSRVPTNDGGISFGQAAIANAKCQYHLR